MQDSSVKVISRNTCVEKWITLTDDPLVKVIDNYICRDQCDLIIKSGEAKLQRALVSSNSGGIKSKGRTGSNCWIPFENNLGLHSICKSISEHVQIPLEHCESMQLIHYKSEQEYRPHFDAFDLESERGRRCTKKGGQRILTALMYLNDVQKGGGTIFPELNIIVEAKEGRLVIFENTIKNGLLRHPLSLHGGLPVEKGEKWAVNLWFRQLKVNKEYHASEYFLDSPTSNQEVSNNDDIEDQLRDQLRQIISNLLLQGVDPNRLADLIKIAHCNHDFITQEIKSMSKRIKLKNGGNINPDQYQPLLNEIHNWNSHQFKQIKTNPSSSLEKGDYLPYFIAESQTSKLDIQAKANKEFILITCSTSDEAMKVEEQCRDFLDLKKFKLYIILKEYSTMQIPGHYFCCPSFARLINKDKLKPTILLIGRNLKIKSMMLVSDFLSKPKLFYQDQENHLGSPPLLIVPDVLSTIQCNNLISFSRENFRRGTNDQRQNKSRFHIHPNEILASEIDDKITKSLLPEIEKNYFVNVRYREKYKICKYDSLEQGKFSVHRDTIDPYRHRRFGLSIALNTDFSGGGLRFPEYGNQILRVNTGDAIVFPGSLFHEICEIQQGERWSLISFLFTNSEQRGEKDDCNRILYHRDVKGLNLKMITPKKLN